MSTETKVRKLPEGWSYQALVDAAEVVMGQSPPGTSYNEDGVGLPFFQGKAEFGFLHPSVRKWTTAGTKHALTGDILMSVRAPVGPTNVADIDCVIGRGLAAIRARQHVNQTYLLWILRSFEQEIASKGTGTTFDSISGDALRSQVVSVPPLDEQERIVEILEEQLSHLDASLASVLAVRAKAARFRRSLLHAAFTGALTGHCLTSEVFPVGWSQCVLGDVVSLKSGFAYKSQDWVEDGVAVIKIANVRNGKVTLDGCSYVTDEVSGETADFEVLDGHLLMTLTGEIGAIGIYMEHRPARLNQRVARIDLKQEGEHIFRYLCLFLESPQARDLMWSKAQGMAQPNISPKEVLQIPFPLAPSDEQVKIVEILEEQLSRLEATLTIADEIEKKASALRRSLLHAAFTGNLTKEWRESAHV